MSKIVLLPLDERPCNALYPTISPRSFAFLSVAPREILGKKKTPANHDGIRSWLLKECADADALVVSLDMLLYGGIVPSRLHHESEASLFRRADLVRTLKEKNPKLKIYAFELLMRCPYYDSDDEEPDYYETEGSAIFKKGYYGDLSGERSLTDEEKKDLAAALTRLKDVDLQDYLSRREVNLHALFHSLALFEEGLFESFLVPQDDSSPYGYTAIDKRTLRRFLSEHHLENRVLSYPGADEVGLSLYAQALQGLQKSTFGVYVAYSSLEGKESIPPFEDRPLSESLPCQIRASGCHLVETIADADFVLAMNAYKPSRDKETPNELALDARYFALSIESFLKKKPVALADAALTNQADPSLLFALKEQRSLLKLTSYAGWNTSGNTLGTAIAEAVIALCGNDSIGRERFLLYRYYEDYGYMGKVRRQMIDEILPLHPDWSYFHVDGNDGEASRLIASMLSKTMMEDFPSLAEHVLSVRASQPWSRLFETEVDLTFKKEGL